MEFSIVVCCSILLSMSAFNIFLPWTLHNKFVQTAALFLFTHYHPFLPFSFYVFVTQAVLFLFLGASLVYADNLKSRQIQPCDSLTGQLSERLYNLIVLKVSLNLTKLKLLSKISLDFPSQPDKVLLCPVSSSSLVLGLTSCSHYAVRSVTVTPDLTPGDSSLSPAYCGQLLDLVLLSGHKSSPLIGLTSDQKIVIW